MRLDQLPKQGQDFVERKGEEAAAAKRRELRAPDRLTSDGLRSWTCQHCGAISACGEVHLGDRVFVLSCEPDCRCITDARESARAKALGVAWELWGDQLWSEAGVPERYQDKTFAAFEGREGTDRAFQLCREYAAAFVPGRTSEGLLLVGPWGSGKTHLAVATAREIHRRTLARVRFDYGANVLSAVKPGLASRGFDFSHVSAAIEADLLVLDDLGQEHVTDFARDVLYQILDGRYQRRRPTIITSNLGDAQLAERFGGAFVSRLYETVRGVQLTASDYRKAIARKLLEGDAA